jgi:hypothetical protein
MIDDEALLAELAEALRIAHEVPGRFLEVGKAAFAWHDVDAELAELAYDSAAQPADARSGTRADPGAMRALTFGAGDITIEIEATADALQGQVVPPRPGEVELRFRDGSTITVPVDEVGWFVFTPPPVGLFRLHLRTADGTKVQTVWTVL